MDYVSCVINRIATDIGLHFARRYSKRLELQRFETRVELEIKASKPEARQSVLLQCLNTDDAARPFTIDWKAYDVPFEEAGSMHPLLRHEVHLWLKTVWGLLKPYEERMTVDDFKCSAPPLTITPLFCIKHVCLPDTARCRTRVSGPSACRSAKRAV